MLSPDDAKKRLKDMQEIREKTLDDLRKINKRIEEITEKYGLEDKPDDLAKFQICDCCMSEFDCKTRQECWHKRPVWNMWPLFFPKGK